MFSGFQQGPSGRPGGMRGPKPGAPKGPLGPPPGAPRAPKAPFPGAPKGPLGSPPPGGPWVPRAPGATRKSFILLARFARLAEGKHEPPLSRGFQSWRGVTTISLLGSSCEAPSQVLEAVLNSIPAPLEARNMSKSKF